MNYDVVIIGSGLAGLTSALLLAQHGRKVLISEQHTSPAPVLSGFEREGISFDTGFHYAGGLGPKGELRPLLRYLGLLDKLQLFSFAADGFDCLRFADSDLEYALPVGIDNIREYLTAQFPAATVEISSYLAEIKSNWRHSPYLDLDKDLAGFAMDPVHGCTLQQRLQLFSAWPRLQSLLSMHSLLYGVSPQRAPFALNAHVAGSYYHSAQGIVGGGRTLWRTLLQMLDLAGVELRCHADVEKISVDAGTVTGIRLKSGEEISAPVVIATLNPALLPELLPATTLRPAYLKRLKRLQQTSSAYIVFGRSERALHFLRRRNRFIQPGSGIVGGAELPLSERPIFLTAASQEKGADSRGVVGIVPAHYSEVKSWGCTATKRTPEYVDWKQLMTERILQLVRRSCPELADLKILELATPVTLRDYSRAPEGALYGAGRYQGQYSPYTVTRLKGLFLAGQGVTLPGLMGTLLSSYQACGSILGHDFLRGELRACS